MAVLTAPRFSTLRARLALAAIALSLSVPLALLAQDVPSTNLAKSRGRLPSHFAQVVTPQQKEQIYGVQAQFEPKFDALQAQLAALEKQRDDAIRALLTPEQRKQVDEIAAAAKAKRDARKAQLEQEENAASTTSTSTGTPRASAKAK
jgi:hypothetical protein